MSHVDPTNMTPVTIFLSGVCLSTFLGAGLIFYRVWRKVHDRFFLLFGCACVVIGLERIPLIFLDPSIEENSWVYVFRLLAFVLILIAVIDANRRSQSEA
ncbi:MAG: hypothetical protein JST16_11260 [Bdellovibrionales bacterium]|nr:hypothetical protein [Bdellovibrionales bacterium]